MPKYIKEAIHNYIQQDTRLTLKLKRLASLLSGCKKSISYISKQLTKTTNPIKHFKMLILIHYCHLSKILPSKQVLQLLTLINPIAKKQNELHNILCSNYLPQYKLYLQKCYKYKLQKMEPGYCYNSQQQIYKLINLIRYGVEFVDVLFIFGRYYIDIYSFIADFNIILAKDIRKIYDEIKYILVRNKKLYDESIKLQLQKIHQKMYIIYYNCYFYVQCIDLQPIWINTIYQSSNNKSKIKDKMQDLIQSYQKLKQKCNKQARAKSAAPFSTSKKNIADGKLDNTCTGSTGLYAQNKNNCRNKQIFVQEFSLFQQKYNRNQQFTQEQVTEMQLNTKNKRYNNQIKQRQQYQISMFTQNFDNSQQVYTQHYGQNNQENGYQLLLEMHKIVLNAQISKQNTIIT